MVGSGTRCPLRCRFRRGSSRRHGPRSGPFRSSPGAIAAVIRCLLRRSPGAIPAVPGPSPVVCPARARVVRRIKLPVGRISAGGHASHLVSPAQRLDHRVGPARRTLAAGAPRVRRGLGPLEEVFVVVRIVVGLVLTVVAFALAGRRLWWLDRVGRAGQPAPERIAARPLAPGPRDAGVEATEVIGQRKLLKWTVPGAAHFVDVLGLHRPDADDHRGLRRPVQQDVRDPGDRALGVRSGSSRTCSRSACWRASSRSR